ncbi:MAG: flagellar basal body P-ring formation protein FlgA [Candidatus Gastranaerophilales bacterium]|nr:flagellar basal body P-ring formation protein FlgA [Candidatus Gastranaerophilales bacterium]
MKTINKFIRQSLFALLPYCFIALLTQSAFCYTLSSDELNKIISNKINSETKSVLKDIEYKINIQGIIPEITTNETIALKVELSAVDSFNPISYRRVTLKDSSGNVVKIFPINVHTSIYQNVLVATDTIPFNKEINSMNTKLEKREISKFYDKVLTALPENSISNRNIVKGAVIQKSSIKQKALIEKNQNVDIVFKGKGIQVTLRGKALKEGAIGESIPVRSDKYNKIYSGLIDSNSKVTVRI